MSRELSRYRLVVVSNRSPYHLEESGGAIRMTRNVSGMVTGLEPVLASTHGMWIAWDRFAAQSEKAYRIPPERPTFDLELVPLTDEEIEHYYLGFSNRTLWPLSINFLGRTRYEEKDWEVYKNVNRKFAEVVASKVLPSDLVWVNDYQLSLVPGFLRKLKRHAKIGFFWHIPFPPLDLFRTMPWREEFLKGMLGANLVGFHCRSYARNFLQAVEELLGMDVSFGKGLVRTKRTIRVAAFPMGIDYYSIQKLVQKPQVRDAAQRIRSKNGTQFLILGVDRLDYSKGIPERLAAVERLLKENPEYVGRISFIQISVPTRTEIPEYQILQNEVEKAVRGINGRFSRGNWIPVRYYFRALPFEELVSYYLAADVCLITPLRDGMNLVAKEYVAAKNPDEGMLVLSEFAGAAEEMKEAVIVNPYSIPSITQGLKEALEMRPPERLRRMQVMRERLKRRSVKKWGRAFLEALQGKR